MKTGPVGIFGGTFNPVHFGHLRSSVELVEYLGLSQLRLMPCAKPPHRTAPLCSAEHRAAMVELAVAGEDALVCDKRELKRTGPSYSIDSLLELRAELGRDCPLVMVMGCDAVAGLDRWHRWQELLDFAHIVVIARPGWSLPHEGVVAQWLQAACDSVDSLWQRPSGGIAIEELRPLAISSTEIRECLKARRSIRYLTPEAVVQYIEDNGLYQNEKPQREK